LTVNYKDYMNKSSSIPNFAEAMMRAMSPYEDRTLRVPFYITNTMRMKSGQKGLSMLMNPTNISFSQSKRITRKDTQEGATFFHWTNTVGRNNDILKMSFQGMTGNINVRRGGAFKTGFMDKVAGGVNQFSDWLDKQFSEDSRLYETDVTLQPAGMTKNTAGVVRLAAFWNLYSLTREPVIDPTNGYPVMTFISYASPLFGNSFVTFIGHFDQVLEFSDSADEPFNKRWSFSFTALDSNPTQDMIFSSVIKNLSQTFLNDVGTAP